MSDETTAARGLKPSSRTMAWLANGMLAAKHRHNRRRAVKTARSVGIGLVVAAMLAASAPAQAPTYDIVIRNGRVIDPESGLDAVRSVGIRGGKIAAIATTALRGRQVIDAHGLVVAPGFIDLHVHGQDDENYRLYAMDGVTTALEMEVGVGDVPAFYAAHQGRALINYGASAGHIRARMAVMHDGGTALGTLLPLDSAGHNAATDGQIAEMRKQVETGLAAGALGVGMGLEYTPAASRYEVLEMFRSAATYHAAVFVHTRATGSTGLTEPGSSIESYLEVIGASAVTGAPVHIVHLNSTSLAATPRTLALIQEARGRGLDVTTEAYPYIAGMTELSSPLLDRFVSGPDSMFGKLMLVSTGERLTRATFTENRRPGAVVILFLNTPEMEAMAVTSPLTAIASDGRIVNGKGHPRTAGTSGRVLGHYVRETGQIRLMDAIRKLSLMPAQRLEQRAPMFRNKGRIKVGADADITVFDLATVSDRATYQQSALPSVGFQYVLVNGVPVVLHGVIADGIFPGQGARAPTANPGRGSASAPQWAYPTAPPPATPPQYDTVARYQVTGSTRSFSMAQLKNGFDALDWFPDAHPPMPSAVKSGSNPQWRACGFCHLPNGAGRPENATLAGLPATYIQAQVAALRDRSRLTANPSSPINSMHQIADAAPDSDVAQAARYFSGLRLTRRNRVVEVDEAPKTHVEGILYILDGAGTEPIAGRLIEVPEEAERHEMHDPTLVYVTYVPRGSLAQGNRLATQCRACHGPTLGGVGIVPPIAGHSPSYLLRQLLNLKSGARHDAGSLPMAAVVRNLSVDDMVALAAYVGSKAP